MDNLSTSGSSLLTAHCKILSGQELSPEEQQECDAARQMDFVPLRRPTGRTGRPSGALVWLAPVAVALMLSLWFFDQGAEDALAPKGTSQMTVIIQRGEEVLAFNDKPDLQSGDRVSVFMLSPLTGSAWLVAYNAKGELLLDRDTFQRARTGVAANENTQLGVSIELDAQNDHEVLAVLFCPNLPGEELVDMDAKVWDNFALNRERGLKQILPGGCRTWTKRLR